MNKNAGLYDFMKNRNAWELLLDSSLAGLGTYGSLRLAQQMMAEREAKRKKPALPEDTLSIPLPRSYINDEQPKLAADKEASSAVDSMALKVPALLLGAPLSAMAADELYKRYHQKKIDAQIQQQEAARLALMQKLSEYKVDKIDDNTPHVDEFCKAAEDLLKEGASPALKNTLLHTLSDATPVSSVGSGLLAILLASGGLTGMMMYNARQAKDKAEQRASYPEHVVIDPRAVHAKKPMAPGLPQPTESLAGQDVAEQQLG